MGEKGGCHRPGSLRAGGSRCHQPVSLLDLYPTLVELYGLKGSGKLDGQSLAPLLRQPERSSGRVVDHYF